MSLENKLKKNTVTALRTTRNVLCGAAIAYVLYEAITYSAYNAVSKVWNALPPNSNIAVVYPKN